MRKLGFLVILTLVSGFAVQSFGAEELFSKVKVTLNTVTPPAIRSGTQLSSASLNLRNRWVVISVEYYPVAANKQRSGVWIDDVQLRVRAVFTGQSDNEKEYLLFTGTSDFWTIHLDGRRHIATMMIPPQLLDRYLPNTGSASTVNLTNTFTVEAAFFDKSNQPIGVGYFGSRGWNNDTYGKYFERVDRVKPPSIPGAILPRNRTPWALVDTDDHDFLKPDSGLNLNR